MKDKNIKPTDSELEILQILWKSGYSTVKNVNDELNKLRSVGYTTTLKTMQIMFEKELLGRERSGRSHTYVPLIKENETKNMLLDKVLQTVFAGSASKLVMQALGQNKASKKEISEIKKFLNDLENEEI
ncbi:MAG: transcriptional regulator [Ignavibacteriales bacterium CG18_big_fil_WC_8_21_14_2_50_31_20]|nr:MAG: transcriptional regulator [Ignavibacteriales bacterium CG18_big_fil_WC_8_21_14_2_50_31_20]